MSVVARRELLAAAFALGLTACDQAQGQRLSLRPTSDGAKKLIAAARHQVGVTLTYDPAYTRLSYPSGDVARMKGVCTDVIIRAYRDALGIDLQQAVHEDMRKAFAAYPKRWGLKRPDSNIDHRRVPNLERFWERAGARLPVPADPKNWQPGDVFSMLVSGTLPHTGIISDRVSASGTPLIIHNIGAGAREDDALTDHRLTGRFRWRV